MDARELQLQRIRKDLDAATHPGFTDRILEVYDSGIGVKSELLVFRVPVKDVRFLERRILGLKDYVAALYGKTSSLDLSTVFNFLIASWKHDVGA